MALDSNASTLPAGAAILAVLGGAVALGSLLWLLPGSPVTLWRADAAVGEGDATTAVALYDDVAKNGWTESHQLLALRRSAAVLASDLGRPAEAVQRMEQVLSRTPDGVERGDLRERIAGLQLDQSDLPAAVASLVAGADADPTGPRAGARLLRAARLAADAGESELAAPLWVRLIAEHPEQRATARLAQGREALASGDAQQAHKHFQEALAEGSEVGPDVRAAAQLGLATALERLGDLEEAIAEIDSADLPTEVRDSRLDALRTRQRVQDP